MFKQFLSKGGVAFFALALLLITFAIVEAWGQQSKPGGTLKIAIQPDQTRRMDGRYLSPSVLYPAAFQMYEFLVEYGPKGIGEIVPGLAESWKQADPLTYLFYLRKGVKFHNGREMVAGDVKENLDWALKTPEGWMPVNRRAYLARVVDKVEVVDQYTLRIRLKSPFALLIPTIRIVEQGVLPPEEAKKWGKDFTLHPSGTGPFKFVEVVPGDRVILERFEGYWGNRPHLDRVVFRTIPDESARLIALQTGEVDVARVEISDLPTVRKDRNLKLLQLASLHSTLGVWFNMRKWPVNSFKFRMAIRQGAEWHRFPVASYAGSPYKIPLEGTWAGDPKVRELLPRYDPERARRLIKEVEAEAGRPIPPVTFLSNNRHPIAQVGELAKTQLKAIGVDLRVQATEALLETRKALKWDLLLIQSIGPGSEPYFLLNYFSTAGEGDTPDGKNSMGYINPQIDELLRKAAVTEEQSKRAKIYQEIERIIFNDLPGFYLFSVPGIWAMNKKVNDLGFVNGGNWIYLTGPWTNTWIER